MGSREGLVIFKLVKKKSKESFLEFNVGPVLAHKRAVEPLC